MPKVHRPRPWSELPLRACLSCLMLGGSLSFVLAEEPSGFSPRQEERRFESLFDGRSLQGWKQGGNWKVTDGAFLCCDAGGVPSDLHYVAASLPVDFELVLEWMEDRNDGPTEGARAGFGIMYNATEQNNDDNRNSIYGAAIDCYLPGMSVRLHTRRVDDASPIEHQFVSGGGSHCRYKDFSKPQGEWNESRILCKGERLLFRLNGNTVCDLDLPMEARQDSDHGPIRLVVDEWMKRTNRGVYLSIIAPDKRSYIFPPKMPVPRIRTVKVRSIPASEQLISAASVPREPEATNRTANASAEAEAAKAPAEGSPELAFAVSDGHKLKVYRFHNIMERGTTKSLTAPPVTEVSPVLVTQIMQVDATDVVARRIDGRAVPQNVLLDELAEPTPVILGQENRLFDPHFLKLFKPESLLLLSPLWPPHADSSSLSMPLVPMPVAIPESK